jgi:hypothetical protein
MSLIAWSARYGAEWGACSLVLRAPFGVAARVHFCGRRARVSRRMLTSAAGLIGWSGIGEGRFVGVSKSIGAETALESGSVSMLDSPRNELLQRVLCSHGADGAFAGALPVGRSESTS